jgi:hypothetical protein
MPLFPGSGRDAEGVQLTRSFHWLASATCEWETRKPETATAMRQTFHLLLTPKFPNAPSPIWPFTYLRNPKAGKSIAFSSRLFDSLTKGAPIQVEGERRSREYDSTVHAGFEKVGPELCNAGTDSKQFEELTTCNPGGSDSPKLRTASARSGETYFDRG